jgi:hypothetical protein
MIAWGCITLYHAYYKEQPTITTTGNIQLSQIRNLCGAEQLPKHTNHLVEKKRHITFSCTFSYLVAVLDTLLAEQLN